MATANNVLQPVTSRGWRRGLANLLGHEFHLWWGTRRWLAQLLIWILLINGAVAFIGIGIMTTKDLLDPAEAQQITPDSIYLNLMQVFIMVAVLCTSVGAVILAQGAIIQEKQMGTAAWILSKPVSRPAFIVSKVTPQALGLLVLGMLVPTIVFYVEISLMTGLAPAPADLLAAMGIWSLVILFYLTLAIMLGTFLNSRGAILGTALGFLFLGMFVPNALPQLVAVFPWKLDGVALLLALGPQAPGPLPPIAIVAVIATGLWIVIFTALAIWRFGREEF
jgi:ABC-2 type transport system permease protein